MMILPKVQFFYAFGIFIYFSCDKNNQCYERLNIFLSLIFICPQKYVNVLFTTSRNKIKT